MTPGDPPLQVDTTYGRDAIASGVRLYPDVPSRRTSTILYDLAVLVGLGLLAWLGIFVHQSVNKLSVLGRGISDVASGLPPPIGGPVASFGSSGQSHVHRLANVLAVITFGVPAALVLWQYLPGRITQVKNLTAASQLLSGRVSTDQRRALAMRAALSLPYGQLARFTRDPLGDLAAERYDGLIAAAFDDAGISGAEPPRAST